MKFTQYAQNNSVNRQSSTANGVPERLDMMGISKQSCHTAGIVMLWHNCSQRIQSIAPILSMWDPMLSRHSYNSSSDHSAEINNGHQVQELTCVWRQVTQMIPRFCCKILQNAAEMKNTVEASLFLNVQCYESTENCYCNKWSIPNCSRWELFKPPVSQVWANRCISGEQLSC